MTTILQQARITVVSNDACYAKNGREFAIPITSAMICAGRGPKISGCHGDSGGPFVCRIGGRWELHGAVSHGSGECKATRSYSVFSRVNHFKDWIERIMRHY